MPARPGDICRQVGNQHVVGESGQAPDENAHRFLALAVGPVLR
ncbi:hypothetical protein [Streptomyces sp. NPDC093260]